MRLDRDRLIFLCLAALDDIMQGCATAPATPSPQFRAVLAMLYALGDRSERALFDDFWRSSLLAPSHTMTEHQANHRRMSLLARMWPAICRHVGVEPSTDSAAKAPSPKYFKYHSSTKWDGLLFEFLSRKQS